MIERRYDIDWIRVIAIGLLLIYHTVIGFQPWGFLIGFITNSENILWLWKPMTMINVWRIPTLFYVSGMGVYLALQNKNLKYLIIERLYRIGLPLVFGSFLIVPIHFFILNYNYYGKFVYMPSMGHLWFLGNILLYTILLCPIFFLLKSKSNIALILRRYMNTPFSFLIIISLFVLEVIVVKPTVYEMYAFTTHGLLLGMLAFITGFLFMYCGEPFWIMLKKYRFIFLLIAALLFMIRCLTMPVQSPLYLLTIETNCWIFSILGFANKYLNRNSAFLTFCKKAAYPIYVIHMIFLYVGSMLLFPLQIGALFKFLLLLSFVFIGSFFFYKFVIKRLAIVRPIFGLK